MTKRITTKIGDVFSVKISEKTKKYFQLIAFDKTQLNSDVIRAFKKEYPIDSTTELNQIIADEVDFYAHCVTKTGEKIGYWKKIGNTKELGNITRILFRDSNDYGLFPCQKIISDRWYIWHINDEKFTYVGKLIGENRNAEIGLIINPESIVYRMKTGIYDFRYYPTYE